ncbi:MAG TPA: ABC transporter substrate-binding protein [Aeriscardovia aeriphila]|uniref:ABC transporter substrate-binding protein n=1 Tax=Aeriscardovia aeriphila TaxID=218139 RepID=A0A921FUT4_9BIFI|nr:ABC transporter substrate-binding protein [Aeriscardovia aeriphila]
MIRSRILRTVAAAFSVAALAFTAACGSSTPAEKKASSEEGKLNTVTAGKLTIATGNPAYTPWVIDDKPESGKGFEAAIAYKVAEKMGFKKSDVKWVRTTFDSAIAPGAKDWDMNIQQFSITPERKKAVDFSPSYYNSAQAVVVRKDSKFANATTLAELKKATIGAMVGSTSYDFAKKLIKSDIKTFNDNAVLAQAVDSNQIDALVIDVPAASYIVESGQVKNGKVLGQIPGSDDPNGTGIVLPKGSSLTPAVTKAMNELIKDGTIKKLQDKWLAAYTTDVPTLK